MKSSKSEMAIIVQAFAPIQAYLRKLFRCFKEKTINAFGFASPQKQPNKKHFFIDG